MSADAEERRTVPVELTTEAQVAALVRAVADEVHDPCGMAIGLRVGLTEMGLVRDVAAEPTAAGWAVRVQLRLTSPGCQYFFYFQKELEARLTRHPDVAAATILWDERIDWTPEDLAASAREKIAARQRLLRPVPR